MSDTFEFVVGGPVQAKSGIYLSRPTDDELFEACKAGEICYVLACRQIGKSSLMNATAERLAEAGVRTARIDLNRIGKILNPDRWYFSLIAELADKLDLEVDVDEWWEQNMRSTSTRLFGQFLRTVVLQEIPEMIVIFIDEIDTTLGLDFTDDFFAAIRTIYNDRAQDDSYRRLTFVLLGVATPDELIRDTSRTPFNIGRAISLRDFTEKECDLFRRRIEKAHPQQGSHYFDRCYAWVNGHPYLTQKLCEAVFKADKNGQEDLVDQLVENLFLAPEERRRDDNLQFVQDRVRNDAFAVAMLRLYKRVLQGDAIFDDDHSIPINRLKLYGLVIVENKYLAVRNQLYAQVFDLAWIEGMLKGIRLGLPDKYQFQRILGQSGFVTVHLAKVHVDDATDRLVALKVLHMPPEADESDWAQHLEQLEQAAKVVAKVNHPHTVHILETGQVGDETMYIEMDYIPGEDLRERLKSGPLPRDEALAVAKQIGAALIHLHAQDTYHLGLNPRDILFDTRHDPAQPVLTDFGLARIYINEPYSQIHREYMTLMTHYIAPELKQQKRPTAAVDVYSLAINLFEMLAGQLPPERQPGQPLPPLSRENPEAGDLFDDVLSQATANDPNDRYQSVDEFIAALNLVVHQELIRLIEVAREYVAVSGYDPNVALAMIDGIFNVEPENSDALRLRGKVYLRQKRFNEALADYKHAYEQAAEPDPTSEAGREYLTALNQVADDAWRRQKYAEAVGYYQTIRQILAGKDEDGTIYIIGKQARSRLMEHYLRQGKQAFNAGDAEGVNEAIKALEALEAGSEVQLLRDKLQSLFVTKHYELGLKAYAGGRPDDMSEAIRVLEREIEALAEGGAQKQSQALQEKLRSLQIKRHKERIGLAREAISNLEGADRLDEAIFQHYAEIDTAYHKLIELELENKQWLELRRETLREQAERRQMFADYAESEPTPDYEVAMRHYQAIRTIEETIYPELSKTLGFSLVAKIAELEEKVNYDRKYEAIKQLMADGKHLEALNQLTQDFISAGIYEHRSVAKLFWALVYAKQNDGNFPPGWNSNDTEASLTASPHAQDVETELKTTQQQLSELQEQFTEREQAVAETQQQLEYAGAALGEERIKSADLEAKLQAAQQELAEIKEPAATSSQGVGADPVEKFNLNDEINKYAIPIALAAAVLAGGIIAPQLQALSEFLPAIAIVALVVLAIYFIYYLWVYYWPTSRNK